MTDSSFRTLRYIEVAYLHNMQVVSIKRQHYPPEEAERIYTNTISKLLKEDKQALVMMREENHMLVKSEQINYSIVTKKKTNAESSRINRPRR
jgi:capsular polysaccharide biosynthesis protein